VHGFWRVWAGFLVLWMVGFAGPAAARDNSAESVAVAESLNRTVSLGSLPPQARQTHLLITSGGPFPYTKDGTVFGNRERLLPRKPRGYYREYTVKTPGARNRGARRIVCGGKEPKQPDTCFYTADHYASFSRIVP
jgi:ribonuclease T1